MVALVTDGGRLAVLRIVREAVPMARERGWMAWEDLVAAATAPDPDGEDGA